MPNKYHQKEMSGKPPKGNRGSKHTNTPEKKVGWGGLPGKSGPNRSNGVEKAKVYPDSEGI